MSSMRRRSKNVKGTLYGYIVFCEVPFVPVKLARTTDPSACFEGRMQSDAINNDDCCAARDPWPAITFTQIVSLGMM
jgi:hypothetical protein